ncbi:MAG TPA: hypothetical protein PK854_12295 [Oscillospiraceae bacterium]|nr:hypothetical protein [Oscillospiraceae bacterium]HPS36030.1 hypothetical protein [Oscillospiraceae bacterium]
MAILNNEYLLPPGAANNPYPTAEDPEESRRRTALYEKYGTAAEAQRLKTQQAIDRLNRQKEQAGKARTDANREAGLTFLRGYNPTGKLSQNIRSAGLAGSGWQETGQAGLTNEYQNALNANSSGYDTAVRELGIAISEAQQNGDIAALALLQKYAQQLAKQLDEQSSGAAGSDPTKADAGQSADVYGMTAEEWLDLFPNFRHQGTV